MRLIQLLAAINTSGLAVIAALVACWELAIRLKLIDFEYLPAPSSIASGMGELIRDGILGPDLMHTLSAVMVSWAAATIIGVLLGLWLGLSPLARRYALATVEVLRPIPGVALAPVGVLLFGFSLETELMVAILPATWPVVVNTMGGVSGVHARLYDVGRTFRLGAADVVWRLLLPAALPSIIVGARLSLGLAVVLAVVAEMVGNPQGLGYGIVREQQALRPDLMFAYIIVVGVLGLVLNSAMLWLTSRLSPAAATSAGDAR